MGYRITKYNPKFRDSSGVYIKDEWTAICDIGEKFNGNIFTEKEYINVEDSYIKTILKVLEENDIKQVNIKHLEIHTRMHKYAVENTNNMKNIFYTIIEGKTYRIEQIPAICRLILREHMWSILTFEDEFEIRFGYDYYMYLFCKKLSLKTIAEISRLNLYVEEFDYSAFDRGEKRKESLSSLIRYTVRLIIRRIQFFFIGFGQSKTYK